jgi:metal-sulfur cluster biosynthetic enzyme
MPIRRAAVEKYKEKIIELLEKVDDEEILMKIYTFIYEWTK